MKKFAKQTKKDDDRSEKYNQKKQTIDDVLNIKPRFIIHDLSINTDNSDFGPL